MELNIGTADPKNKILWEEIDAVRAAGGYTLTADTIGSGTTGWILKGLPMAVNYTTRVAEIVKTATVITGSTTTITRISKGGLFIVGDVIANVISGNGVAITAIDTTNASYDSLTHLTNGGAFVADTILFEAAAVGTGDATYLHTSNSLLSDNTKIVGSPTVTAVISAQEIQETNLPAPITTEIKTALLLNGKYFQFV